MAKRYWTEDEIKYLETNVDIMPLSAIASDLGRSYNSVLHKAINEGLHSKKPNPSRSWTSDEIEYICKNYDRKSVSHIAYELDRSEAAVKDKARKLGLRAFEGEFICVKAMARAFSCDSRVVNRWIDKYSLKCRYIRRGKMTQKVLDSDVFWKWAEDHKDIIPFHKYERYSLIPEPEWLILEIRKSRGLKYHEAVSSSEQSKIKHMRMRGSSFDEIASELNRTVESVKHIWRRTS